MHRSRHQFHDVEHPLDEKIFEYNNLNTNFNFIHPRSPSISPLREVRYIKNNSKIAAADSFLDRYDLSPIRDNARPAFSRPTLIERYERYDPTSPTRDRERDISGRSFYEIHRPDTYLDAKYSAVPDQEEILRLKWLDNSPRMSRLRESRSKRLASRLEQFELWDMEQEQKQKQYELAREQRYNNIIERLRTQDFCLTQMRRRHESDLETTKDLETYEKEHLFIDALDNNQEKQRGPLTEYRRFEAEMDDKLKTLEAEIDEVNPKYRIQQAIIPRLERTREIYSVEPDIYTVTGKRVLRRPSLTPMRGESGCRFSEDRESSIRSHDFDDIKGVKYYYPPVINDQDIYSDRLKNEIEHLKHAIQLEEQQHQQQKKPKPIIRHSEEHDNSIDAGVHRLKLSTSSDKRVNFKDDVKDASSNQETKTPVVPAIIAKGETTTTTTITTPTSDTTPKAKIEDNLASVDDDLASEMVIKKDLNENKSENTTPTPTNNADSNVVVNGEKENDA